MAAPRFGQTASPLADGTVLIAGGLAGAVTDTGTATVDLAEIYNPSVGQFVAGPAMVQPRQSHTATLLKNGEVLIAGGDDGREALETAELFDPKTGSSGSFVKLAAVMIAPRTGHTATELDDAPGRVLIAGGSPSFDPTTGVFVGSLASAELFDPRNGGQFEQLPFQMNVARSGQAATLLANGSVLITGGVNQQGLVQDTAEIFRSPSVPFTPAGVMNSERFFHGSILLPDGTVLIVGGVDGAHNVLASAEIYNPARNSFTLTSNAMNEPRQSPATVMLSDGRALIVAGSGDDSAEIYDPASQSFTLITGPGTQRLSATATSLGGSDVLVAGGFQLFSPPGEPLDIEPTNPQAELIDTTSNSFLATGSIMTPRAYHTATFLDPDFVQGPLSGMVLIAGGKSLNTAGTTNGDAQLYDPQSGTFSSTGTLHEARALDTATVLNCPAVAGCPDGQVLLAGGFVFSMEVLGSLATAELYNPAAGSFSATGALTTARFSATATSLAGGHVLVAGGLQVQTSDSGAQSLVALDSAEVYDPVAGTFDCVGGSSGNPPSCNSSMNAARALHAAAALADGTVLLTGGFVVNSDGSTTSIATAEVFDLQKGSFAKTAGPMNEPRAGHTATFLDPKFVTGSLAGKVLIAGGTDDLSAEIYDPGSGMFTLVTANMNSVHSFHTATLLQNGRVLIAGGGTNNFFALFTGSNFVAEPIAEIFDPPTQTFVLANPMNSARALQTATLLDSGNVLVTGGASTNSTLAGTELFMPSDPPATCTVCAQ